MAVPFFRAPCERRSKRTHQGRGEPEFLAGTKLGGGDDFSKKLAAALRYSALRYGIPSLHGVVSKAPPYCSAPHNDSGEYRLGRTGRFLFVS